MGEVLTCRYNISVYLFILCIFRMLDEFGHEIDTTESRMDNVMKKMAKVLHMSNGRNFYITTVELQWLEHLWDHESSLRQG